MTTVESGPEAVGTPGSAAGEPAQPAPTEVPTTVNDEASGRQIGWVGLLSTVALVTLLVVPMMLAIGFKVLRGRDQRAGAADAELISAAPIDGDGETTGTADCTIEHGLSEGATGDEVRCLETKLNDQGYLDAPPDGTFDQATVAAVEAFQKERGLVVDGVVGPETGNQLGTWVGPDTLPPDPKTCPKSGHAAVIDRFNQRNWLCNDGKITKVMPMTSAAAQPDPGSYKVFEKDMNSSSTLTGRYSTMTHFVAFTTGKFTGARVAFHSVPKYDDGSFVQPLSSVGSPELFGESSGCIRVLPEDAQLIWDWLDVGDPVIVVS